MDRSGERIRARRMDAGLSQRALAEAVEISPSYLNLIEHGRRPVGGQLLRRLARALGVDLRLLAEPEDRALLERVRAAVAGTGPDRIEIAQLGEFVARYPGFATLIAEQADRIADLRERLRRLDDRIAHDPELAASLHAVISAVTGIQSSAAILTEAGNLDADWQSRFQRNIFEDAGRLADTSRALVAYLDTPSDPAGDGAGGTQDGRDARGDRHRESLRPARPDAAR